MPLLRENKYTIQDIYRLPEGQRAELIDGVLYDMAPPSTRHQEIVGDLFAAIKAYIKGKNGTCKPYVAPFAVFLNDDDSLYMEPDISVICNPQKISDKGCQGAPDWIIEVVSPTSRRMDYMVKLFKYRTAGVREYWIVDPLKSRVLVYDFEREDINEYTFEDKVKVGIYDDLEIDFSEFDY